MAFFLKKLTREGALMLLLFMAPGFSFEHDQNDELKQRIRSSIKNPSSISLAFNKAYSGLAFWTPQIIKGSIDSTCAFLLKNAFRFEFVRSQVKNLAFSSDDKVFAQYDRLIGIHTQIPDRGIDASHIFALIEEAKKERVHWADGKMSGGVYDSSKEHLQRSADFFALALDSDPNNREIFKDQEAKKIAVDAFTHFQTSNPLHGTMFPLSVKAMRELSSMFAGLVGQKHAIVSSGSAEALRIGLRALKNQTKATRILAPNYQMNHFIKAAATLNCEIISQFFRKEKTIAAYRLDQQSLAALDKFANFANRWGIPVHLHLSNSEFRGLFMNALRKKNIEQIILNRKIASISFDTEGLIFQGISATIFANIARFDALESYISWKGGVYTSINSAGSIPGADYIIAYLLALYHGMDELNILASKQLETKVSSHKNNDLLIKQLIQMFHEGVAFEQIFEQLCMAKGNPELKWPDFIEELLTRINLSLFSAPLDEFSGKITSGGTESIRQIVQIYYNRYRKTYRDSPIFLMSSTAHVAFERHMADIDARIIRIKETPEKTIDLEHLRELIIEHGDGIAGIIASTPNYPFGTMDDIKEISALALQHNVPFHVDACLGGFILQFIDSPQRLFLDKEEFAGVTSWSADLHKYGFARKGLSFRGLRKEFWKFDHSNEICAKRSCAQMEVGLLSMLHVGKKGYVERAENITKLGQDLVSAMLKIPALEILLQEHQPAFVVAFRLRNLRGLTYNLGSIMSKLGWHLSTLNDYTIHIAITSSHTGNPQFLNDFIRDLKWAVNLIEENPNMTASSSVGIYGMAADFKGPALGGQKTTEAFLNRIVPLYVDNLQTVKR